MASLYGFIPLGISFSMVNFTYGVRGLDPSYHRQLLAWIFCVAAYSITFEILFRGLLLRTLLRRFTQAKAFILHQGVLMILLFAAWLKWAHAWETMGLLRFLLVEHFYQIVFTLFFLRTGSVWGTAFLHTLFDFPRFFVLNDAVGPFETLYFYSAATDDFYWLIAAMAFLVMSVQYAFLTSRGSREIPRQGAL